jgi:transposase
MWTTENRPRYDRDKLRYPSDLTDAEWSLVEPLIPPAKRGGRRREVVLREVVNGVMYVLSSGCQWRYVPKDLPPRSTVHDYLTRWRDDGTIEKRRPAAPRRRLYCNIDINWAGMTPCPTTERPNRSS